jgi:hypothetical protein
VFLVPILCAWCVYGPTIIYLRYFFPWKAVSLAEALGVVYLEVFVFSFVILCSSSVLLEMIRQLELGESLSVLQASGRLMQRDTLRILPLAFVWALIWFILTIVEALLSRRDRRDDEFTAENVARTLADYKDISLSVALIKALEKGVRMVVFLILPAIVWERRPFKEAVKRGLGALKGHVTQFATGYALTYAAAGVVFLPPAVILELGTGRHGNPPMIVFPHWVWIAVIIYIGLAWSFCMYLEQMFMASLYSWQMNWEDAAIEAARRGEPVPAVMKIPVPQLLDLPELREAD